MKSTLANIRQLFNVENIVDNTKGPGGLLPGEMGFLEPGKTAFTGAATIAGMPDEFTIMLRGKNGELYRSFDTIKKENIKNARFTTCSDAKSEIWETVISCCSCMNIMKLDVGTSESQLIQEYGLSNMDSDFEVVVAPEEMKCYCNCDGTHKVYENNVMTMLFVTNAKKDSPYYEVKAALDSADVPASGSAPSTPSQADLWNDSGSLKIYDGSAWVVVGTVPSSGALSGYGVLTDPKTFVEVSEIINTDSNTSNDGPMLTLIVQSKNQTAPIYHDIELKYVYPRGVHLQPSLNSYGGCVNKFTKIQDLEYPIGDGYDLRASEWENMTFYTGLNYNPLVTENGQNPELNYQFENGKKYCVLDFEFTTDKVERNNGDKRLFGVTIATLCDGSGKNQKNGDKLCNTTTPKNSALVKLFGAKTYNP